MEHVTHLELCSRTNNFDAFRHYPTPEFPNLTHLSIHIHINHYNCNSDRFSGLVNLLPSLNPTHLRFQSRSAYVLRFYYPPNFGRFMPTWTRLKEIIFDCNFVLGTEAQGHASEEMTLLLHDSVSHLEGVPRLGLSKPKVVFDWRVFGLRIEKGVPIGRPTERCSLLRLPGWMQFEIVIDPQFSWFTKDGVERWLDDHCTTDQLRTRVTVTEMSGIDEWLGEE